MNKRTTARRKIAARTVDPSRHERLCTICSHPEREAIEEAFLHWRSLSDFDEELDLPSADSIYRHAHAIGLFEQRSRNMRLRPSKTSSNAPRAPQPPLTPLSAPSAPAPA